MRPLSELEGKLGLTFSNKALLERAMTHPSFVNEHGKTLLDDNERLEFLGDACLELAISTYIYEHYPNLAEGTMTKLRARLVCEEALAIYACYLELQDFLLLGNGEEVSGGRTRPALLADAFEAMLAAIYIEFGFAILLEVIQRIVLPYLAEAMQVTYDYKSELQEQLATRSVVYETQQTGPSHKPSFTAFVKVDKTILLGRGEGKTKKEAEQNAAKEALSKKV